MVAAASAAIATARIAYLADLPSLAPIPITAVARVLRRRSSNYFPRIPFSNQEA